MLNLANLSLYDLIYQFKYELCCLGAACGLVFFKYYALAGASFNCSRFNLKNKVAIITGSNTGIGFEVALELAKRNATVVLACRDLKKARLACELIKSRTSNDNVFVEELNLASFNTVKEFVNRVLLKYHKIHLLINNAGKLGVELTWWP